MITLQYAEHNAQVAELEERLTELSLAFQSKPQPQLLHVQLMDGTKKVEGYSAIQAHLDELSKELHQWYYCNC